VFYHFCCGSELPVKCVSVFFVAKSSTLACLNFTDYLSLVQACGGACQVIWLLPLLYPISRSRPCGPDTCSHQWICNFWELQQSCQGKSCQIVFYTRRFWPCLKSLGHLVNCCIVVCFNPIHVLAMFHIQDVCKAGEG
jgi:hypothetical protein